VGFGLIAVAAIAWAIERHLNRASEPRRDPER
jgi:hypothetical protein